MFKKEGYVSDIDRFLKTFNDQHPIKSLSQQAEIEKHKAIARARNEPTSTPATESAILWESF